MYEFYNPHPQNKLVGDCVKRAFTKASGKTYQEVSNELNRIKRAQGASAYNSNSVWREYVNKNLAGREISFPAVKGEPRMSGAKFCDEYPEGTYVLRMAGHLCCCVDGVIYDTWNPAEKCVYAAYEIPKLCVNGIYYADDMELPVASAPSVNIQSGTSIIQYLAEITHSKVKKTKKGELWISLTPNTYSIVEKEFVKMVDLRWDAKRGKKTHYIRNLHNGMEIILKDGANPYVWCINEGEVK